MEAGPLSDTSMVFEEEEDGKSGKPTAIILKPHLEPDEVQALKRHPCVIILFCADITGF